MIGDTLFAYWDSDADVETILDRVDLAAEIAGKRLIKLPYEDSTRMREALATWTGDLIMMVHGFPGGDRFTDNGPDERTLTAAELLPEVMPASTVVVLACNQNLETWTKRAVSASLVAVTKKVLTTAAAKQLAPALLAASVTSPTQFQALCQLLANRQATPEAEVSLGLKGITRALNATDRRVSTLGTRVWETHRVLPSYSRLNQSDGSKEIQN